MASPDAWSVGVSRRCITPSKPIWLYGYMTQAVGKPDVWVAGYCHEVFGYLPSAQIVREGGYEMRGLLPPAIGYFSENVEEVMVNAVRCLASDIERMPW